MPMFSNFVSTLIRRPESSGRARQRALPAPPRPADPGGGFTGKSPTAPLNRPPMFDMTAVSSSNVASIGYDADFQILQVLFRGGGLYQYDPVSPQLWWQFQQAPSKGRFVQQVLRPLSRAGQIGYYKISGPGGKKPNPSFRSLEYLPEPEAATYPGGYRAHRRDQTEAYPQKDIAESRLGRILARDREQAAQPAAQMNPARSSWLRRMIGGR